MVAQFLTESYKPMHMYHSYFLKLSVNDKHIIFTPITFLERKIAGLVKKGNAIV